MTDPDASAAPDRAEAQFLLLAESAAEMIVRADPDGVMTYVSPSALQITGFAPDELLGCAAWDLCHPGDLPVWRASRERLGWGLDGETLTYRCRRRGGGWVMLESTLRAVRGAGGDVIELQIATRDVTERRLADAEHAALHRVTEAVASESEGAALYPLVAREMARLLDAAAGRVVRYREGGAQETGRRLAPARPARGRRRPAPRRLRADPRPRAPLGRRGGGLPVARRRPVGRRRPGRAVRAARAPRRGERRDARAAGGAGDHRRADRPGQPRDLPHRARGGIRERGAAGPPLALAVIDLDRFKVLNDTMGHRCGDDALAAIGGLLRRHARRGDVVGRTGGEELAWLMPDTRLEGGRTAAERLRAAIAEVPVGGPCAVTASIGVTELLASDADPDEVFRRADAALYAAKAGGRDRVMAA